MTDPKREMFDAGNAATIHDRLTGHLQTGATIEVMHGDELTWEWRTGVIIGWWGTEPRNPHVRFSDGTEAFVRMERVRQPAVKFDPTRIPSHSEAQFSPDMSDAEYQRAINNDDMMREHCE